MKNKNFAKFIPEIVRFFALGEILKIENAGGGANANFFVKTAKGEFFIKIILEPCNLENKLSEVSYLRHVIRYDIPATPYLVGGNGKYIFNNGAVMAMAQYRVTGHNPKINRRNVETTAYNLGRLHLIPIDQLPPRSSGWFSQEYIDNNLSKLGKYDYPDAPKILNAYQECEIFVLDILPKLPKSIIHGDAQSENVLFENGRLTSFVDWEDSMINVSLLDLMISVSDFCFTEGIFKPDLYRAFLHGYTEIRPLNKLELENLENCLKYVGVVQTMWRFLRYGSNDMDRKIILRGLELANWKAPVM